MVFQPHVVVEWVYLDSVAVCKRQYVYLVLYERVAVFPVYHLLLKPVSKKVCQPQPFSRFCVELDVYLRYLVVDRVWVFSYDAVHEVYYFPELV